MFPAIVAIDLATGGFEVAPVRRARRPIDPADVSVGVPIEFPTTDGRTAHAILYRPHNRRFRAPEGELPPLVVTSHGGPTAQASSGLSVGYQILTSRGIAVVDVDYGGSTGYGKAYRKRLEGQWGIVDVDDCVNAALELARRGEVDVERLAIEGGSASGYTTLAALAFRDTFRAGRQLLRDRQPRGVRHRDAQVREPLPRAPGRALPGGAGALSRTVADPPRGWLLVPGPDPPGAR